MAPSMTTSAPRTDRPSETSAVPEWIDLDSDYVDALESAGFDSIADALGGPWTWYHTFLSELSDEQRAAIVGLCQEHDMTCTSRRRLATRMSWTQAASMLNEVFAERRKAPDGWEEEAYGVDWIDEADYKPELAWDADPPEDSYDNEFDPSDAEPDMGYRDDYDEDE